MRHFFDQPPLSPYPINSLRSADLIQKHNCIFTLHVYPIPLLSGRSLMVYEYVVASSSFIFFDMMEQAM